MLIGKKATFALVFALLISLISYSGLEKNLEVNISFNKRNINIEVFNGTPPFIGFLVGGKGETTLSEKRIFQIKDVEAGNYTLYIKDVYNNQFTKELTIGNE